MSLGKALTDEENDRIRAGIKKLLPRYGNNQQELADALVMPAPTLSRILGNKMGTSIHVAKRVAELLEMRWTQLLDPTVEVGESSLSVPIPDPGFPTRAKAELAARVLDCTDVDIRAAIEAHDIPEDPGDVYWITEFLRARDRRRRREAVDQVSGHPSSRLSRRVPHVRLARDK